MTNPCRHCEKRHENCHASCQEYDSWKKEYGEQKAEIDKTKKLQGETKAYIKQAVKSVKRGRRKK